MPPSSREIKGAIKKQCATASRVTQKQRPSTRRRLDQMFWPTTMLRCVIISFRTLASRVSLVDGGIEKARGHLLSLGDISKNAP
ncbi:hypothetical protein CEXT_316441 [Caerostris extrusa]|uniref:Uncharacterized protein n=1 Tax=Caerostris extrusa TaxID=172846 RepID=A0AAV4VMY9_CAEEX|nr:hypothetical protein CEXT_316441 [Caerostris extrusa]